MLSTEFDLLSRIKRAPSGCWEWQRAASNMGYGVVRWAGRQTYVHRVVYELFCGPLVPGLFVLHMCDNRRCANPVHLYQGSHQQNMDDMVARGRSKHLDGEEHRNAKLSTRDVQRIRRRYHRGGITHRELAAQYDVSGATITNAVNRVSYKEVPVG